MSFAPAPVMESEARSISPILRGLLHEAARDLITDWTPVQAHAASVTEVGSARKNGTMKNTVNGSANAE